MQIFRMGIYYMMATKYHCAQRMFLCGCKYSPSSEMWLGLGSAYYHVNIKHYYFKTCSYGTGCILLFRYIVLIFILNFLKILPSQLGKFDEAELALTEANYLDYMCPVVWAYLTLVNIQLERYDLVELCYSEAKKVRYQRK